MSRFSKAAKKAKKSFEKHSGVSVERAALASATFGASEIHTLGGGGPKVIDYLEDPTGAKAAAKAQIDALRAAGKFEEAQRLEIRAYRDQIEAEGQQFREQGSLELERLRGQRPGETEFYRQSLERGTEDIAQQRSRFGLVESGRTGEQFEELGSNLLLQEEIARQQGIGRAAALSQTGYGAGLEALRQEGGATYRQAQTTANIGAAKASAKQANRQFYLGLGTQVAGGAAGYFAGGGAGAAGSSVGASASQSGGNYNLQYPQYNQFQPQYPKY